MGEARLLLTSCCVENCEVIDGDLLGTPGRV